MYVLFVTYLYGQTLRLLQNHLKKCLSSSLWVLSPFPSLPADRAQRAKWLRRCWSWTKQWSWHYVFHHLYFFSCHSKVWKHFYTGETAKPALPKWSRGNDAQGLSREISIGSSQERSEFFSISLWTVLLFIWPEEQKDLNCLQRALEDYNSYY